MILVRLSKMCICLFMLFCSVAFAAEKDVEPVEQTGFLPAEATNANWVFSGLVANEGGDHYAYYFEMQRHGNDFHVKAALFDEQTKAMLLMDEGDATISDPERNNWHVAHSFLRFNAINDSWIFGFKTQDKKGFNFKVDMLNQPEHNPVTQGLRAGVDVIVSQTGQLNGHIQVEGETHEQFVTSNSAWFRQIWLSNPEGQSHKLSAVLCRFDDGSGFYSMNMLEPDAVRGAVAGWYNEQGEAGAMSQFINVKEGVEGAWHIHVTSPKLDLTLLDEFKQPSVAAGFVSEKDKQGFCVLNKLDLVSIMLQSSTMPS